MYEQGSGWTFGAYGRASSPQVLNSFPVGPTASIDPMSPTTSSQGNANIMSSPQEASQSLPHGMHMPVPLDRWLAHSGREQGGEYIPNAIRFNGSLPENVGHTKIFREPHKSDNSSIATGNKESGDSGYGTRNTVPSITSEEPNRTGLEISTLEAGFEEINVRKGRRAPSQPAVSEQGERATGRSTNKNKPNQDTCPICAAKPRLASELKKHMLKHQRPFVCNFPDCEKSKPGSGFTTTNDLERHKASKHGLFTPSSKIYKCAALSCAGKSKKWPRLDNFRQHVERTHPQEDKEDLVKRSQCDAPLPPPIISQAMQNGEKNMQTSSHPSFEPPSLPLSTITTASETSDSTVQWPIPQGIPLWHPGLSQDAPFTYLGQATSQQTNYGLLAPQAPSDIARNSRSTSSLDLKHYQPKSEQSTRERSSSRASSRVSGLNNRASSTSIGRSRSTSGKSDVIIHNSESPTLLKEPFPLISEIARIFGKEEDEDAKRKVSILLEHNNTELFHLPPSNKRRALARTTIPELQPGPDSKVRSLDELNSYRQRNSQLQNFSPKSESSSGDVHYSMAELDFECREANCHAQLSGQDKLSRHMQEQHQSLIRNPFDPHPPTDASTSPASFKCPRSSCSSKAPYITKTALDKHAQRHERRFGCTFDSCQKRFGSKNDWKRHENSQHFQVDIWKCDQSAEGGDTNAQVCQKLFYRKEVFASHLRRAHSIEDKNRIDRLCKDRRIGVNGQSSFWCGFCKQIKPLASKELSAWDERFDHIGNHFTKEHLDIDNWVTAGGKKTKWQVRKEMQNEFKPPVEVDDDSLSEEDDVSCSPRPLSRSVDNSCVDPYFLGYSTPEEQSQRAGLGPMDFSTSRMFNLYCCQCGDGPYPLGGSELRCNGNGNANSTSACGHIFCSTCHQSIDKW